jgi:hypothetical protein
MLTLCLAVAVPLALAGCPADDDDSAGDDDDASGDDDDATDDDDDDVTDDDDDATGDDDTTTTDDDDDATGDDDDDATGDDDSTGDDDTTSSWTGAIDGTLTANALAPTATTPFAMRIVLVDNADWAANGFNATPLQEAMIVSDLPAAYTVGYHEGSSVEVLAFLDENENGTIGDAGDLAAFSMTPITVSDTVDLDFFMAVP